MTTQKYYYHHIPKASEFISSKPKTSKKTPWVIGIIDSSGSMCSCWTHVVKNYNELISQISTNKVITYCFSSKIHREPSNKLKDDIYKYEGGMTNILLAFEQLDKELKNIPDNEEVKVVFVSDGADTCNNNLETKLKQLEGAKYKKITFMCVGVQSGFPTFMSMFLREKYHRGDSTVPSIFLIEYASDKAFFNKFQSLVKYFDVKEDISIDPPQKIFPWEPEVSIVPEDTWIMSYDSKITLNDTHEIEFKKENFSVTSISDLFRSWSQKIQLDSIGKKISSVQAKEVAQSSYNLMMAIVEDVKASTGIDLVSDKISLKLDFLNQVLNLQKKLSKERIIGYLKSVKEIKEGKDLTNLSEFEAAKIIGLGTIIGKRQQRALALKTITKTKLKSMIKEFLKVKEQIVIKDKTDFVQTKFTKTDFHKFLQDSSLKDGLNKIDSPVDLLDLFPLMGLALTVKRTVGFEENPWNVNVKEYSKTVQALDSRSIDFLTHKMEHEEVTFNAVLPLLGKADSYLAPLFKTEMMRYLMSYNVCIDLDRINLDPYLVLLSEVFVISYINKDTELTGKIINTLECMKSEPNIKELIDGLEDNDDTVYGKLQSKGSSCFLLLQYYLSQKEDSEEDEKDEIVEKIWIDYFTRRLSENSSTSVRDYFIADGDIMIKGEIDSKYSEEMLLSKFFTAKEVARHIKKNFEKEIEKMIGENNSKAFNLNHSKFQADVNNYISYKFINTLTKDISGKEITDDQKFIYLSHCNEHKNNSLVYPVSEDIEQAKQKLVISFSNVGQKSMKKRMVYQALEKLQRRYYQAFKKIHWNVQPLGWDEIIEYCTTNNIDSSKLSYNASRKWVSNACQARKCPHFLRVKSKRLRNHLGGWQALIPQGFHLYVYTNKGLEDDVIYKNFLSDKGIKDIGIYGVTKKKVIEYISSVRKNNL